MANLPNDREGRLRVLKLASRRLEPGEMADADALDAALQAAIAEYEAEQSAQSEEG